MGLLQGVNTWVQNQGMIQQASMDKLDMFSCMIISCTCDQGQGLGSTNSKRGEHKQLTKWPKNHEGGQTSWTW
jgi:hypothetical protein